MAIFRSGIVYLQMNFGRWKRDYRIWIILIFTVFLAMDYLNGYAKYAIKEGREITYCLLPLLHIRASQSMATPKILFYLLFVLIVCDAPFLYEVTPYAVMRSGRKKWWVGECLYIAAAAFVYMFFLTMCCFFIALPAVTFQNNWGNGLTDYLFGTDTHTVMELLQLYPIGIDMPSQAVKYLNPMECQFYTFFAGWATMVFLGFILHLANLVLKSKFAGVVFAAFFVLLDPIASFQEGGGKFFWLPWFSPLSWTSVEQLNYVNPWSSLTIPKVAALYAGLLVVLLILIGITSKKISIEVSYNENGN